MKIGERIKIYRESRGLSQAGLAEAINVSQTAISSWERGRTTPSRDAVVRIADALGIPPSDIERNAEETTFAARFKEVPLISWVSAGTLKEVSDLATFGDQKILIPDLPGGEFFVTEVRGDSMDRISPEGSRIVVNASDTDPVPGRYYVFSLRGETTYKRFQRDPVVRLEPFSTNPANQLIFPRSDSDWTVIGRVVRSYIDLG